MFKCHFKVVFTRTVTVNGAAVGLSNSYGTRYYLLEFFLAFAV